jgi:hypothetical protein
VSSNYYQYSFISPQSLYALIKEELNQWFISGAVDDTLFPLWTQKVLDKLGKGSYVITTGVFSVKDHEIVLPDGFKAVREAWALCTEIESIQTPASLYTLEETLCLEDGLDCDGVCKKEAVKVVCKTTGTLFRTFEKNFRLSPGNVDASFPCLFDSTAEHRFDVQNGKLFTTLEKGDLYLVYYQEDQDCNGYQLIPDNVHIKEALEAFIKFKLFEMLFNQASDDSFNQSFRRKEDAEADYNIKMVKAETETKKRTTQQIADKIKQSYRRHQRFNIK